MNFETNALKTKILAAYKTLEIEILTVYKPLKQMFYFLRSNKVFLFKKKKNTTIMRIHFKEPHITKSILYQKTNIKTKFTYLSKSLNPSFLKEISI